MLKAIIPITIGLILKTLPVKGNKDVIKKINKCIKKFLASDDYAKLCKKYDLSPLETK